MRCPECGQGFVYQGRVKTKTGAWKTVFYCDEDWLYWDEEVCREKEIDYHSLEVHEGILANEYVGEVNYEISRDIYFGWDKQETAEIDCPYCRDVKLIHGITAQTKREIYECPYCQTIWIGCVCPENVSNYRKYMEDGLRIPDETETDRGGIKYPAMEDVEPTDISCLKCKGKVFFGRIRTTSIQIFQCGGWCHAVWLNSVCPENEINYREYLEQHKDQIHKER